MPFLPGMGIPYGISPFAFSTGTAAAGNTVGAGFSSLRGFDGSSTGLGCASAAIDPLPIGRLEARFFVVGPGEG